MIVILLGAFPHSGMKFEDRRLILSYFSYPELYTQSLNRALDTVLHSTLTVTPSHDQLRFDQVGGSIMGCSFFFLCFYPSVLTGESY
jgi:hypothetical protein